jgi:hypothetical protein
MHGLGPGALFESVADLIGAWEWYSTTQHESLVMTIDRLDWVGWIR